MMRMELNADGSIKDVERRLASYGFNVGDTVARKADKSSGKIISVDAQAVRLEIAGDVVASVPIEAFLKRQWSTVSTKVEVELTPTLKLEQCPDFMNHRICTMISLELSNLAMQHQHFSQHIQIHTKPKKGVRVTKSFAKGKLLIVPVSLKVAFGASLPKAAVAVSVPGSTLHFWLVPLSAPKEADDITTPFWYMTRDTEDNMEMMTVKTSSHSSDLVPIIAQIPIARNSKPLSDGDWLVLPKLPSDPVEPLQEEQPLSKRIKRGQRSN